MRRFHLVPVLLAAVLGCASVSTVPRSSSRPFRPSRNVVTGDEIRAHGWASDALRAIRSLRPEFLRAARGRNELPAVYVDGIRYHDLMDLKAIGSEDIADIRFLNASEVLVPFGGSTGAIMITTRRYAGQVE